MRYNVRTRVSAKNHDVGVCVCVLYPRVLFSGKSVLVQYFCPCSLLPVEEDGWQAKARVDGCVGVFSLPDGAGRLVCSRF